MIIACGNKLGEVYKKDLSIKADGNSKNVILHIRKIELTKKSNNK